MLLLHPYLLSWSPDLARRLTGAGSLEVKVGIAPTAFCIDAILYILYLHMMRVAMWQSKVIPQ